MTSGRRSGLTGPLFDDPEVARRFGAGAQLQAMLDVEAALAEAEAEVGVIPPTAAAAIRSVAREDLYSTESIAAEAADAGNAAIPLVRHLTAAVGRIDAEAAAYVHRGATSQDILDTALVLQLKSALPIVQEHLARAAAAAARLAREHAATPMIGRTWLQAATPVTFGVKAAGWLDAIERARVRNGNALNAALVIQLGGPTGTLAALGSQAASVVAGVAQRLGLAEAPPWHTQRDRLVELGAALGITAGTLGKVARDLALLAQTEVAEAHEAPQPGRGGSSSMPHKQNPVASAVALSAATRAPGLVATLLAAMPQEHERGLGGWHAEWETLPELVCITAGAARAMANALDSLVVDPARMRANLEATRGITLAEAVAAALAPRIGRTEAHERIAAAASAAARGRRSLLDVLAADQVVRQHLTRENLEQLLSPEHHLRESAALVDRVLSRWGRS